MVCGSLVGGVVPEVPLGDLRYSLGLAGSPVGSRSLLREVHADLVGVLPTYEAWCRAAGRRLWGVPVSPPAFPRYLSTPPDGTAAACAFSPGAARYDAECIQDGCQLSTEMCEFF